MTPLLHEPAFVGMQSERRTEPAILGAEKNNQFIKDVLDFYNKDIWEKDIYKIPDIFTRYIFRREPNFTNIPKNNIIHLKDISIYPREYFIPFNGLEPQTLDSATENTYTAHWFGGSWVKPEIVKFLENKHKKKNVKSIIKNLLNNIFSIRNECRNTKKRKVIKLLGFKIKLSKYS
jgi:mannosyltransferase OCH1-like enzyme